MRKNDQASGGGVYERNRRREGREEGEYGLIFIKIFTTYISDTVKDFHDLYKIY